MQVEHFADLGANAGRIKLETVGTLTEIVQIRDANGMVVEPHLISDNQTPLHST